MRNTLVGTLIGMLDKNDSELERAHLDYFLCYAFEL